MRFAAILIFLLPFTMNAQFNTAAIFTDNMVIQRDRPVHIWGKGIPGREVKVLFAGKEKITNIKTDSSWSVNFEKHQANAHPQALRITCGVDSIEFKNILIGDIWLCLGQSNMEWPVVSEMHFTEEKSKLHQPLIRMYNPIPAGRNIYGVVYDDSLKSRLNTKDFYQHTEWEVSDSLSARSMSAVGYYFAKNIVDSVQIPIGLINLSIGGAPIEAFIRRSTLENNGQFAKKIQGNWLYNQHLPEWIRMRALQNIGVESTGFGDDLGLNHAYKPGFAYASGLAPLTAMAIKGILWYQGESNALELSRVIEYRQLLKMMISDYRASWKQLDMPFYWVQLSSIDTVYYPSHYWPLFRDEQCKLLEEVKHSGMAVSSDIGSKNDIHPSNKKTVGERLSRWALRDVYGKKLTPSGPLPIKARYRNGKIKVCFHYVENGITTADGKPLRGFTLDGIHEASAMIKKRKILIPTREKPAVVYYAWKPFSDANLVNAEGLPASGFRLEVK